MYIVDKVLVQSFAVNISCWNVTDLRIYGFFMVDGIGPCYLDVKFN